MLRVASAHKEHLAKKKKKKARGGGLTGSVYSSSIVGSYSSVQTSATKRLTKHDFPLPPTPQTHTFHVSRREMSPPEGTLSAGTLSGGDVEREPDAEADSVPAAASAARGDPGIGIGGAAMKASPRLFAHAC
jgi:hypothetical protein